MISKQFRLHSGHMELAVANLIGYRANTIVPNVSYGLYLNHECDMLVLDSSNRFTEIEIKVSMSDLKADFNKTHGHKSKYISRLVYAIPETMLEKGRHIIPKKCGIIIVKWESCYHYNYDDNTQIEIGGYWKARWERMVRHNKQIEEIPKSIINKFYQLGCMRIWSLKAHNNKNGNK